MIAACRGSRWRCRAPASCDRASRTSRSSALQRRMIRGFDHPGDYANLNSCQLRDGAAAREHATLLSCHDKICQQHSLANCEQTDALINRSRRTQRVRPESVPRFQAAGLALVCDRRAQGGIKRDRARLSNFACTGKSQIVEA